MDSRVVWHSDRLCDIGTHAGQMRISATGYVYMTTEEYEKFLKTGHTMDVSLKEKSEVKND